MRVLQTVKPSREQLPIVLENRPGVTVVRGAAGSGKTTTALLRLRQLCAERRARRERIGTTDPVRVVVLTYNRSLAGYVAQLAAEQVQSGPDLDLTVGTFAEWAYELTGRKVTNDNQLAAALLRLGHHLGFSKRFLIDEVDYALGRFAPDAIGEYVQRDREGRGLSPRVDKARLLTQVLQPYLAHKRRVGMFDWHDLAIAAGHVTSPLYDVVVVDEAQDFSANQIRAVLAHRAPDASITFVLDTVQRIYPRFYTWREVGLDAQRFVLNTRLKQNRRNTRQIAALPGPL